MLFTDEDIKKLNKELDFLKSKAYAGDDSFDTHWRIEALRNRLAQVISLRNKKPILTLIKGGKYAEIRQSNSDDKPSA